MCICKYIQNFWENIENLLTMIWSKKCDWGIVGKGNNTVHFTLILMVSIFFNVNVHYFFILFKIYLFIYF